MSLDHPRSLKSTNEPTKTLIDRNPEGLGCDAQATERNTKDIVEEYLIAGVFDLANVYLQLKIYPVIL